MTGVLKLARQVTERSPAIAGIVLENRLDGVGLLWSEYLFLNAERPSDIEAQTTAHAEVAAMLAPLPVVIRTMDLGGDKMPRSGTAASKLAVRSGLRAYATRSGRYRSARRNRLPRMSSPA